VWGGHSCPPPLTLGGWPSLVFFPNIQSGGAPSFAHSAKGGNHTPSTKGFRFKLRRHVRNDQSHGGDSIVSHPCKKRKDGAPSFGYGNRQDRRAKDGPPSHLNQKWGTSSLSPLFSRFLTGFHNLGGLTFGHRRKRGGLFSAQISGELRAQQPESRRNRRSPRQRAEP
jgi:hypothetical protein